MADSTVVFLGAGASVADGAPGQACLLSRYFGNPAIQNRVDGETKTALRRYFDRVWGIDVSDSRTWADFPTFEEVLGMVDIADARSEAFAGFGDDPHGIGLRELRSHLVALIRMILDESLSISSTHTTYHRQLLASLDRAGWLSNTAFVSLNYDTLIDNAIEYDSARRGQHALPDYGFTFVPTPRTDDLAFPVSTTLLKLRGSLNWAYCRICGSVSLFPHHRMLTELDLAPHAPRCVLCHGHGGPIWVKGGFEEFARDPSVINDESRWGSRQAG